MINFKKIIFFLTALGAVLPLLPFSASRNGLTISTHLLSLNSSLTFGKEEPEYHANVRVLSRLPDIRPARITIKNETKKPFQLAIQQIAASKYSSLKRFKNFADGGIRGRKIALASLSFFVSFGLMAGTIVLADKKMITIKNDEVGADNASNAALKNTNQAYTPPKRNFWYYFSAYRWVKRASLFGGVAFMSLFGSLAYWLFTTKKVVSHRLDWAKKNVLHQDNSFVIASGEQKECWLFLMPDASSRPTYISLVSTEKEREIETFKVDWD